MCGSVQVHAKAREYQKRVSKLQLQVESATWNGCWNLNPGPVPKLYVFTIDPSLQPAILG